MSFSFLVSRVIIHDYKLIGVRTMKFRASGRRKLSHFMSTIYFTCPLKGNVPQTG